MKQFFYSLLLATTLVSQPLHAAQAQADQRSSLPKAILGLTVFAACGYALYRYAASYLNVAPASKGQPKVQVIAPTSITPAMKTQHTALLQAITDDDLVAVLDILSAGADINAQYTWSKKTALMHAIEEEKPAIVALLLEHGADRSLKDIAGNSAKDIARRFGQVHLLEL
jgi:ankyrin repeat protein